MIIYILIYKQTSVTCINNNGLLIEHKNDFTIMSVVLMFASSYFIYGVVLCNIFFSKRYLLLSNLLVDYSLLFY
jgi:hypothetical protein